MEKINKDMHSNIHYAVVVVSELDAVVTGTLAGLFVASLAEEFSRDSVSSSSIDGQLAVLCSVLLNLSFKAFIARFLKRIK